MEQLGQILLAEGWIENDDLAEARRHQEQIGGLLGTCLLELELVTEQHLVTALSLQFGVDAVSPRELKGLDPEVTDTVPTRMACRGNVVPFERFATTFSVAMQNPNDLQLQDELSFVLGKRVEVFVAPQVRIKQALRSYYGCDVEMRFGRLWTRLDRMVQRRSSTEEPAHALYADGLPELPPFDAPDLPEAIEPSAAATDAATPSDPPAIPHPPADGPAPSPAPPRDVDELAHRLSRCDDRDEIARLAMRFFGERFRRVVLFLVRAEEVVGWMGEGPDLDDERLAGFEAGFDTPSLFLNLRAGSSQFRGPLTDTEIHRRLARIWGGPFPPESLALPVRLGDRLVTVVYCDDGPDDLDGVDLGELRAATEATARGFESLLVRRKRGEVE